MKKLKLHKYLTEIKRREICKHKTGRNGKIEATSLYAVSRIPDTAYPLYQNFLIQHTRLADPA